MDHKMFIMLYVKANEDVKAIIDALLRKFHQKEESQPSTELSA